MTVAALTGGVLGGGSAQAQGLALSRFEPAERGSRLFVADSLDLHSPDDANGAARPRFAAGMPISYAHRTRTFGASAADERSRLVEHALYLHPGIAAVFAPGARFAIDVPIAAIQSGTAQNLGRNAFPEPRSPVLGDVRASFDLRIFGPASRDVDGLATALGVSAWLPTGALEDYAGDDGARFGVHVAAAHRFRWLLATARLGYMYRRDANLGASRVGSEATLAAAIAWTTDRWTIGPEIHGATLLYDPFEGKATPLELLLGLHRSLGAFRGGVGVGSAIVGGLGAAYFRSVVSLEWVPGAIDAKPETDRDRDGVPDAADPCPDVAGPNDGSPSAGCPPPPSDRDGDGVPDPLDACPDVAGPPADERNGGRSGCPEERVPNDE